MANIQFSNFARSTLSIGAAPGATSLVLSAGTGVKFPALSGNQFFYLTLENASLVREIVKVTARSTDTLTVVRAQDGTTAQTWSAGDVAALRLNAAAMGLLGQGATGGGDDRVFVETNATVTTDYTISTGFNALSGGPLTINSGVTVTVPSGSNWTIV